MIRIVEQSSHHLQPWQKGKILRYKYKKLQIYIVLITILTFISLFIKELCSLQLYPSPRRPIWCPVLCISLFRVTADQSRDMRRKVPVPNSVPHVKGTF